MEEKREGEWSMVTWRHRDRVEVITGLTHRSSADDTVSDKKILRAIQYSPFNQVLLRIKLSQRIVSGVKVRVRGRQLQDGESGPNHKTTSESLTQKEVTDTTSYWRTHRASSPLHTKAEHLQLRTNRESWLADEKITHIHKRKHQPNLRHAV